MWFVTSEEKEKINEALKKVEKIDEILKKVEKIDGLEQDVAHLMKTKKEYDTKIYKIHNILEHIDSKPGYRLAKLTNIEGGRGCLYPVTDIHLFIYSKGREYDIIIDELRHLDTDEDTCEFRVEDNIAYFSVTTFYYHTPEEKTRYEFIIDYKNEKYICVRKNKIEKVEE